MLNDKEHILFYELPYLEEFKKRYLQGKIEVSNLSPKERWCTFIKYRNDEKLGRLIQDLCSAEEGIMRTNRALEQMSTNMDEWTKQLFREKAEMDYRSGMHSAWEKGSRHGFQKGIQKIVQKMKAEGLPLNQISLCTGLSIKEIEGL